MGTTTTNYGLYKPAVGETGYATAFGTSQDTVDTRLKADADAITAIQAVNSTQTADIALRWRDLWLTFTVDGTLTVAAGTKRLPIPTACSVQSISATVTTPSVGAAIILDVNRGTVTSGTTPTSICSTRPQISAGSYTLTTAAVLSSATLTTSQYLTIDVDQVGSGTAGANLVVVVALRLT